MAYCYRHKDWKPTYLKTLEFTKIRNTKKLDWGSLVSTKILKS